jgi:glutamine---fructose-6-phosphate transaminase (isomerizing)
MEYLEAVHGQAENLAAARKTVRAAVGDLDLDPWRRGTVGVVAMGAAYHAAHAFLAPLRAGGRRAYPVSATELLPEGAGGAVPDLADVYVAVSQSGKSRETVTAMELAAGRPRLGVTNEPAAPLSAAAEAVLPMGSGEDSPIYTNGYTATLQALGLLADELLRVPAVPAGSGWDELPHLVDRVLAEARPVVDAVSERLYGVRVVDFAGQGPHLAAAAEGALLVREGARVPSSGMDTYQYLHGPLEPLEPGMACVLFGDGREVSLARDVAATGAVALLVTRSDVAAGVPPADNLFVLPLPAAGPVQRAVLEILPVQLLTWNLALARGIRIEGFRHQQADTKLDGPVRAGPPENGV